MSDLPERIRAWVGRGFWLAARDAGRAAHSLGCFARSPGRHARDDLAPLSSPSTSVTVLYRHFIADGI